MKKILYALPLILIAFSLIITGCSKDNEVITPVDENIDKEAISSKNMMEAVKLIAQANSTIWVYSNSGPSTGCPNVFFDSTVSGALITNYGPLPGCTASDGIRRSGSYAMPFYITPSLDSIFSPVSFNDYRIYKSSAVTDSVSIRVIGTLYFSSKKTSGTSYNFHSNGEVLFLTNAGYSKTVTLNSVHGTANLNSPSTSNDDEYLIYGTLKVQDSEHNITYTITINQSAPLKILNSCGYPLSGIANFSATSSSSSCDFSPNGGVCDAIVKMTKGTFSAAIDLSTINF